MKRIVKIGIAVLTAIVVLGLVVGCDNGTTSKPAAKEFTITFNLNGGDGTNPADIKVEKDKTAGSKFPANPTRAAGADGTQWVFGGWFENAAGTGTAVTSATPITKNLTLYAKWVSYNPDTQWLVSFNLGYTGAGAPPAAIPVNKGTAVGTLPVVTRAGFDFLGWFESADATDPVDATFTPSGNVTLTARWDAAPDEASLDKILFGSEEIVFEEAAATLAAAKGKTVTLLNSNVTITASPSHPRAEVEFLQVASGGEIDESEFWSDTVFDFLNGDTFYVRVTAANGVNKAYYRFDIQLGDVAITSLKVGGKDVANLPLGGSTWRSAALGAFVLFQTLVTEGDNAGDGIEILAEAEEGATIEYAKAQAGVEPTGFSANNKIKFVDNDYLYLKVTGVSTSVGYYKVEVSFKRSGRIKYGSPVIGYGTAKENVTPPKKTTEGAVDDGLPQTAGTPGFIDPIWNDTELEVYPIDRIYQADSTQMINGGVGGQYIDENGKSRTVGTAKALWDEEGLSIFLKVIDSDVVLNDNGNHECDSLELFVNEAYSQATNNLSYGNGGSQYRVGAGGRRSGEGGWNVLRDLNKTAAWKASVAAGDGFDGYYVLLKAPWRLRSKFFDGTTTYMDGWKFGFELQINVGPTGTGRYGVQIWNNIAHTNYQNANDYGVAELYGHGNGAYNFAALPPTITVQPKGDVVSAGDTVNLTVTATTLDGGTITYEWFKGTSATDVGTSAGTGNSLSFTFTPPSAYYYAVATNSAGGKTATTKSAVAGIIDADTIVLSDDWVEQVTIKGTAVPLYGFKLPSGKTFGDYDRIKLKFRMDKASHNMNGRLRAWGNYAASVYVPGNTPAQNGNKIQNKTPDGLLLSTGGNVVYSGEWIDAEIVLSNRNALDDAAVIKAATGVVLLGFAPVPSNNGADNVGPDNERTYYVKNVTLTNTDGSEVVKVLPPAHPLLWGGKGQGAYVTQDFANEKAVRKLYDWVDKVHMVNTSVPLYGFNLPEGKTFADYTKIKINMKMADPSVSGRLRVFGTYADSAYVPGASSQAANMQNASPGGLLIGSSDGGSSFTDAWTVYERTFNNLNALDQKDAIKASSGVILLGIGPIPGAGASATKDYYVMGITLENDDGTQVVNAMSPDNTLLWAGNGKGAFVTGNGSDQLTRTLQAIDFADFDPAP